MTKYKAIMAGMFNSTSVNKRLREAYESIEALEARIVALEGGVDLVAAVVSEEIMSTNDVENQTIEEQAPEQEEPESPIVDVVEDIDDLREEARSLGVRSWHVMGADKLRKAIAEAKAEGE